MGANFAVQYKSLGSSEALVGFITRCRDKYGSLGYAYDFSGNVGIMADDSTSCVAQIFECFGFVRGVDVSIDGKAKILICTHESDTHVLFNCSQSSSKVNWYAFCRKLNGKQLDDFKCVGQHVIAQNRGSRRVKYLCAIQSEVGHDGKIGPPMAGLHQGTQPTISDWARLDHVVEVDEYHPPSKQQHFQAVAAIKTHNGEFPTMIENLQQRRDLIAKRKLDERAQQQEMQRRTNESSN